MGNKIVDNSDVVGAWPVYCRIATKGIMRLAYINLKDLPGVTGLANPKYIISNAPQ